MRFTVLASVLILGAAITRLLPHPPNVTPLAGMALVGAAYLDKRFAFAIPLVALLVSDIYIGFHSVMPFTYGSFLLIALIGLWLRRNKKPVYLAAASLASSIIFFIVTNFGVWVVQNSMYPKTIEGLAACYLAAVPFFRNTVIGDLLSTGILFGLFEIAESFCRKSESPSRAAS